jgi:hypothetical protein
VYLLRVFYMHNGHRKQAARDWVKKGQKGRPQTGGVRENMKSLQARYLDRLAELYPTIAAASTEIIDLKSAERNGTFPDRYPWGIRGIFSCIEKWFRFRQAKD